MSRRFRKQQTKRRGAVAVEFAFVAPVFVIILTGYAETNRLFDVSNQFTTAARVGARTAAMDREGLLQEGQTTNEKVIQDIRSFLNANDLPGDDVTITIADDDNRDVPFDLDDPDNNLEYFQIIIEIRYGNVSQFAPPGFRNNIIRSRLVFRNARAAVVQ